MSHLRVAAACGACRGFRTARRSRIAFRAIRSVCGRLDFSNVFEKSAVIQWMQLPKAVSD